MSLNHIDLPNEIIPLILLYCQTPKDYLSQLLVNRAWSYEAHRIKSVMKSRFARKITSRSQRFIMWDFDTRITAVGHAEHIQRHGLEEFVQTYHRVGGPSSSVHHLERYWHEGKLHGLEIVREINFVWYSQYYSREKEVSHEQIIHPYEGLSALDSMRQHGRHLLVPQNSRLPKDCDYLGKILFKYEWNSGTLEDSKRLHRTFIDTSEESDLDCLFDFVHKIDLHAISIQK